MKKKAAIALSLLLTLSVCGCSNHESDNTVTNTNEEQAEDSNESVLVESNQYKLANQLLELLIQNKDQLDFGKYSDLATNVPEYADNNCKINKLIEEKFGNNIGDWLVMDMIKHYGFSEKEVETKVQENKSYIDEHYNGEIPPYIAVYVPSEKNTVFYASSFSGTTEYEVGTRSGDEWVYHKENFDEILNRYKNSFVPKAQKDAITASQLFSAFDDNAVSFDQQYLSKTITVSGSVKSVESSSAQFELQYGPYYVKLDAGSLNYIRCYFTDPDQISKLKKGDNIYVNGTYIGDNSFSYVGLVGCELIDG